MRKVLKNGLRRHIRTWFRGREIIFKSKNTKVFDMDDEEQKAEYLHWKQTYEFLYDLFDLN